MSKIVMYCVMWGLGSHLSEDGQTKFQVLASGLFKSSSDGPKGDMFDNYLSF